MQKVDFVHYFWTFFALKLRVRVVATSFFESNVRF